MTGSGQVNEIKSFVVRSFPLAALDFIVVLQQGDFCTLILSNEHVRDKYKLSFLVTIQFPLLIIEM